MRFEICSQAISSPICIQADDSKAEYLKRLVHQFSINLHQI